MFSKTLILAVILGINNVFSATISVDYSRMKSSDVIPRILHGKNATIEEHPYIVRLFGMMQASLLPITFPMPICTGAILSPNVVVTAAHCFGDVDPDGKFSVTEYVIFAGSDWKKLDDDKVSYYHVKKIAIHEKYDPPSPYNDIAIVQLEKSIELDDKTMKAIKRFESGENIPDGAAATIVGWDSKSESVLPLPTPLQSVDMEIVDKKECEKSWNELVVKTAAEKGIETDEKFDMTSLICATSPANNELAGACSGDSGGPLVVDNKLAGITSFSTKECSSRPEPNVFTDVAYHYKWINEKVAEFAKE